jgi:DNA-binding CsgD family transcriptional regulator
MLFASQNRFHIALDSRFSLCYPLVIHLCGYLHNRKEADKPMALLSASQLHLPVRVALEPVSNALYSFSLLNEVGKRSGLNTWVVQTAAVLTPEQRHTNQVVFAGLYDALPPAPDDATMPSYLRQLAASEPSLLQEHLLEALHRRIARLAPATIPETTQLLNDVHTYLHWVQQVQGVERFDPELQVEVHQLLQNPSALQQTVLVHLEFLWQTTLEKEWKRVQAPLRQQVAMFMRSLDADATLGEIFRTLTGRELPHELPGISADTQEVVLVPSWHTGRQVTTWECTAWREKDHLAQEGVRVFFSEPPNYNVATLRATPVKRAELRARLSALADETRLEIIELLTRQDELPAQEIIAQLGLSQSSVSRHLKQLVALGYLYERRGEGANKTYRLSSFYFERTMHALQQLVQGELPQDEDRQQPVVVSSAPELRRFVDKDGRLTMWPPAKQGDKLLILEYLAGFFEPGRVYSEMEMQTVLLAHSVFKDTAALRRALYEYRFMNRERDGSRYWLTGTEPAH